MPAARRPNILIFVMDTQPVRNLTPYGYSRPTTPNLERSPAKAWSTTITSSPAAGPCRRTPSLFTGKYQSGHGTGVQHEFMSAGFPTMAEVLAGARAIRRPASAITPG